MKRRAIWLVIMDVVALLCFAGPCVYLCYELVAAAGDCNPDLRRLYVRLFVALSIGVLLLIISAGSSVRTLVKGFYAKKTQLFFAVLCCLFAIAGDAVMHEEKTAGLWRAAFIGYNALALLVMATSVLTSLIWNRDLTSVLDR